MFAQLLFLAVSKKYSGRIPITPTKPNSYANSIPTSGIATVDCFLLNIRSSPTTNSISNIVGLFAFDEEFPYDQTVANEDGTWVSFMNHRNERRYCLAKTSDGDTFLITE